MSQRNNEQLHGYVEPEPIRLPDAHHALRLVVAVAIIAAIIFIVAGFWYTLGFTWAFSIFCACVVLCGIVTLAVQLSHRKWTHAFLEAAVAKGHSVEFKTQSEQLRTISPWTVPAGPLTIKDVNIGDQAQLQPVLPVAPPFSQIAEQVGPGHLFLGQGNAGPIWGDITSLLSTVIAGRPGTGKSTNLRSVCGQLLIIGGQPVLFDPHGSILDQLGSSFDCAESPREIAEYAHILDTHLEQRLRDRRAGKRDFKPLLLLADEMPNIHETSPDALPVIKRIISEGRKVAMFALIAGVGVPASLFGGTFIRDSMASRYVFNTSPQQARLAGLENETAKTMMAVLESAGPGKAVLATSNRSPEIVAIPYTSTNDIKRLVASTSSSAQSSARAENESGRTVEASVEARGSENDRITSVSSIDALREIGKRLQNGEDAADIVKSFGLPYGRATQQLRATVDMAAGMLERGEL
jgi:hypothetical protein